MPVCVDFIRALTEHLDAAPGIESVNLVDTIPVTLSNSTAHMLRDGDAVPPPGQPPPTPQIYVNAAGPGHFKTLRISLLAGRDFTFLDGPAAPGVAIVNETFARRFWPGQDAVGRRLRPLDDARVTIEVIGVVRDSKYMTVGEEPRPFLYRPLAQAYVPRFSLLVRSGGTVPRRCRPSERPCARWTPACRSSMWRRSRRRSRCRCCPRELPETCSACSGSWRWCSRRSGSTVCSRISCRPARANRRARGDRATPRAVAAMVVRQAMVWTGAGAVIGVALAAVSTRFLTSFLYGVSPADPWTFGGVTLLLGLVACAAAVVPAVRASRLDPLVALRSL